MFYAQVGSARCDACDWLVLVVLPPTSEGGGEGATRSIKLSKLYWKNSLPAIEGHETVISVSVLQPASYAGLSWVNLG